MRSGKSAGSDGLTAEALQQAPEVVIAQLAILFAGVVNHEWVDLPTEWRKVTAVLIPKQSEWSLFKHLRPIMLLPIIGKLYSRCLG